MWDAFSHIPKRIADGSNGDVACDSYHQLQADINLLKELGVRIVNIKLPLSRQNCDKNSMLSIEKIANVILQVRVMF